MDIWIYEYVYGYKLARSVVLVVGQYSGYLPAAGDISG